MLYQVIEDGEITGSYSMPDHDDTHHLTSAKRDTANGVAGIDASKEMINDVPVSLLVDTGEQSFINLLDGDFESWNAGVAVAPDGWVLYGAGAAVARESTSVKIKTHSAKITYGSAIAYLKYTFPGNMINQLQGRNVSAGCWVKTSTASCGKIQISDNSNNSYSSYHTGSGNWEWITVSFTIGAAASAIYLKVMVFNPGFVYFDGAMFVEGFVCPAFSPKPLTNTDLKFRNIASVSSNTTLTDAHYTVNVDTSGGARTITLPGASVNLGRIYRIKKIDASGNAVTIDGAGAETIDGAVTQTLPIQWNSYTIQSDGTGWFII